LESDKGALSLFSIGKTLRAWEGDPTYWSVKDGLNFVGLSLPAELLKAKYLPDLAGGEVEF